jgi:hypothetical protein
MISFLDYKKLSLNLIINIIIKYHNIMVVEIGVFNMTFLLINMIFIYFYIIEFSTV